jgi:hypothetical protein
MLVMQKQQDVLMRIYVLKTHDKTPVKQFHASIDGHITLNHHARFPFGWAMTWCLLVDTDHS